MSYQYDAHETPLCPFCGYSIQLPIEMHPNWDSLQHQMNSALLGVNFYLDSDCKKHNPNLNPKLTMSHHIENLDPVAFQMLWDGDTNALTCQWQGHDTVRVGTEVFMSNRGRCMKKEVVAIEDMPAHRTFHFAVTNLSKLSPSVRNTIEKKNIEIKTLSDKLKHHRATIEEKNVAILTLEGELESCKVEAAAQTQRAEMLDDERRRLLMRLGAKDSEIAKLFGSRVTSPSSSSPRTHGKLPSWFSRSDSSRCSTVAVNCACGAVHTVVFK